MKVKTIVEQAFLVVLLLAVFLLKSVSVVAQNVTVTNSKDSNYSYSSSNKNGVYTIHVKDKGNKFKLEYEGEITLSDDDKDIVAISRGGFLEISKSSFGGKRKLVIEAESGKLRKRYYVGWSEKSFIPEGKAWLAEILPDIVRSTTIGAEKRVNRFYSRGGVTSVLNEIDRLKSDYVQTKYYKLLLEKNLNNSELIKVIEGVGNDVDSDYYLAEILQSNQKIFLANSQLISAYMKAAKNINSDYYLSEVLTKAVKNADISDDQLSELLQISSNIGSDYYLSQLLIKILNNRDLNKTNMTKLMQISDNVDSDYYKSQVLKKALNKKDLSKENYNTFIASMDDVDSDYYASNVINSLLNKDLDNTSLNKLLELINKNVGSDYYASGIYKRLSKKQLTDNQLIKVIEAMDHINSSNYLSQTLSAFAPQVKRSSQRVKDAYLKMAKSINSDLYFGRAMKAIY